MNKKIKILLLTISVITLVIVANITMKNLPISKTEIEINYKGQDKLITQAQIYTILNKKYGDFTKYKRKEIETEEIENYLRNKNLVYSADVYLNLLGTLTIEITQNNPILRLITLNGKQYYIDEEGNISKTLKNKAANVIVINGNIKENLKNQKRIDTTNTPIIHQLHTLTLKIKQDSILKNQIDQIYYNKKSDIEMIPKVGDYVIKLGGMDNIDIKLTKLSNLYKEGFSEFGWDNYSMVKLEFEGQVVCVRK